MIAIISIFIFTLAILLVLNYLIQKYRTKEYYKKGFVSAKDSGIIIQMGEDNSLKIKSDETISVIW